METKVESKTINRLGKLVGTWEVEAHDMSFRDDPSDKVYGFATFAWLERGLFLHHHAEFPNSEFPTADAIIGWDDKRNEYMYLYSDSRGVSRIYRMTFDATQWRLERDEKGFPQRFSAEINSDGSRIEARWENAEEGPWKLDFSLIYSKT